MGNDVALLGVGLGKDRFKLAAALVGAVAWVYVNVQRPQAEGTVVSGAFLHWENLFFAVYADKSAVVFGKSFIFHDFEKISSF